MSLARQAAKVTIQSLSTTEIITTAASLTQKRHKQLEQQQYNIDIIIDNKQIESRCPYFISTKRCRGAVRKANRTGHLFNRSLKKVISLSEKNPNDMINNNFYQQIM